MVELGARERLEQALETLLAFGEASIAVMRARAVLEDRPDARQDLADLKATHGRLCDLLAAGDPGVCELALSVVVLAERTLGPPH